MTFSPRPWRTTSALTEAPSTTGRPIDASSPSTTSRTRSTITVLPGSTSSSSTSSSVPTSTRYCFPPVSMTAYMDPQDFLTTAGDARGDRAVGHGTTHGDADARTVECTAEREFRSIERGARPYDRAHVDRLPIPSLLRDLDAAPGALRVLFVAFLSMGAAGFNPPVTSPALPNVQS